MSLEASVVFRCDRCGATVGQAADPKAASVPLPDGWKGADVLDREMDLCPDCVLELQAWIDKAPEGPWPPDARRFARFFLSLPYERRHAFLEANGLRGDPVAAMAAEGV